MKLRKLSQRLTLRSAIAAIVMLMLLCSVWLISGAWLGLWLDLGDFGPKLSLVALILYILLFIPLIGCFLFVVRDVYIHGVANKYPRATVAARVLGALGASAAVIGFLAWPGWPLFPMGIATSLMAVRGIKLALARPKLAGVWMLLAGIVPWIVLFPLGGVLGGIFVGLLDLLGLSLSPDEVVEVYLVIIGSALQLLLSSLFLIPGGVAAFLSARKKGRQERLASMSKG